jgi:hypothetical protein
MGTDIEIQNGYILCFFPKATNFGCRQVFWLVPFLASSQKIQ